MTDELKCLADRNPVSRPSRASTWPSSTPTPASIGGPLPKTNPAALRRDPAFGPQDDPHPRTGRPHPPPTRRPMQYRGSRAARRPASPARQKPTRQILCDGELEKGKRFRLFDARYSMVFSRVGRCCGRCGIIRLRCVRSEDFGEVRGGTIWGVSFANASRGQALVFRRLPFDLPSAQPVTYHPIAR